MKKYLALLVAGLSLAGSAGAAVILDETFTYADGALTNVSAGKWAIHSGTTAINVAGEKAIISQANSQDNNAQLTGAPYSSGNLYASFVVNFSALPTGGGTYFAHFKDATTSGFRCRVFSVATGAAAGSFRVGIARGSGAAVVIPTDLSLNTDHLLVIRYDAATTASTLWINPGSEGAVTDRAEATTDTTGALDITSFGLRQAGNLGTLTLDNLKVGTAFTDVVEGGDPSLNPPFISSIASASIPRNGSTLAVPFYVTDGETANGDLTVLPTASSNPGLLPIENITITSDGGTNRTVMATPVNGQQGFAEVTVTVTDGDNNTASRVFLVIVGTPTISVVANQETPRDTATAALPFTIGDLENDSLTLSATSTNETVVPVSGISFGGSGNDRTVTITPAAGANGLTRITLFVTDGFNIVSNSFLVTVYPSLGTIFNDDFNAYEDGALAPNSGFTWNTSSGTTEQIKVLGGKIYLSGTNSEDVQAFLGTQSYLPSQGWILYSSFTVNFARRPVNSGNYFAHFRNVGGSFGAKVFSVTNGAAPGKFRLGLANSANSPSVVWAQDLETNVTYTVVTRMNVAVGTSRLWINPASESSTSITGTDATFPFEVITYAFREDSGIGDFALDDFKSGTAFTDVSAPRYSLTIASSGADVRLSWPVAAAGYNLQVSAEIFPTAWEDSTASVSVEGDQNVVSFSGTTGYRYFRLIKP